jgi:polysaccharide pyruvyl transferase CsaB
MATQAAHGGPWRIGISGSYGGLNLGDEAILESIIAQLRASLPVEITVFSRDADDTRRRHAVERVVPVRRTSRTDAKREVERLDLFILGGGGLLYDSDAARYLREVTLAHEASVPVMLYAVSAGPLEDPAVRSLVRDTLNEAEVITVRDRWSQHLLDEIGVHRDITLTADPAVLLEPAPLTMGEILRNEAISSNARLVGFSVREPGPAAPGLDVEHYHRLVANAADFIIDRIDAEVVFFPLEPRSYDIQHSHGIVSEMRNAQRATVLKGDYTPGQIVSLLQHFQMTVGMRLHFLILSALAGVPFVALPYTSKVSGFVEELNIHYPPLQDVSAGQLIAALDRAWDRRKELRAEIREAFFRLQERARLNNALAVRLVTRGGSLHGTMQSA